MKIKNKKNIFSFLLVLVTGVGVFFLVAPAHAADAGWAATIVANLISVIISGLGMILSLVISALIAVAQYSNFINAPAVTNGWKIVRDVCNMFFVLVLLIIAFATILKIEKYNYKQWLPKLILMAILINFSKTICGLLIDFTQVIMLTFVNAFKDVGGGNIVDTLGLKDIMTLATNDNTSGTVTFLQVTGGYLIGLIYLLIALVVIITMLAMLVIRMVMIWIYVVLSPAAYLFSAFPDGKAYASQWWSEFTKNLIVGPVLAFFIWLSFASLQATNITVANGSTVAGADTGVSGTTVSPGDKAFSATNASTPNFFIKFVVAIGMLIGGLTITQQIGGTAGGMAGKGMNSISKGAKIGMGGLAAATGYRYASGVVKNYSAQRKAKREETYKLGAERLAGNIGMVKKTVAMPLNKVGAFIKDNTYNRNGVKAQASAKEAKEAKKQADLYESNFKYKQAVGKWKYNDTSNKWETEGRNGVKREKTNDEMEALVVKSKEGMRTFATKKENESKDYRKKQNTIDKVNKYAMPAAGAVLGLLTGGLPEMIALGVGAPKLGKSIKNAGDTDLGLASNYRLRQITEAKDKMKMDSNDDVVATMDDSSKSAFTRAAAAMEAMDRGVISLNDASNKKEEIKDVIGGRTSDGGWKDKKVGSYVENMFEKKYPGGTKTFEALNAPDLQSADPEKRKVAEKNKMAAEKTIRSNYESGVYSLDLDTGTLEKSIGALSMVMRNGEFVKQFKGLKNQSKKDSIVKALKNDDSQGAKEKLALVKDLNFAFGSDQAGKEKALSNFSMEDLVDVFRKGTLDQQTAIKNAVASSTQPNKIDIFANAKNDLGGTSPTATDMRVKLAV